MISAITEEAFDRYCPKEHGYVRYNNIPMLLGMSDIEWYSIHPYYSWQGVPFVYIEALSVILVSNIFKDRAGALLNAILTETVTLSDWEIIRNTTRELPFRLHTYEQGKIYDSPIPYGEYVISNIMTSEMLEASVKSESCNWGSRGPTKYVATKNMENNRCSRSKTELGLIITILNKYGRDCEGTNK